MLNTWCSELPTMPSVSLGAAIYANYILKLHHTQIGRARNLQGLRICCVTPGVDRFCCDHTNVSAIFTHILHSADEDSDSCFLNCPAVHDVIMARVLKEFSPLRPDVAH